MEGEKEKVVTTGLALSLQWIATVRVGQDRASKLGPQGAFVYVRASAILAGTASKSSIFGALSGPFYY